DLSDPSEQQEPSDEDRGYERRIDHVHESDDPKDQHRDAEPDEPLPSPGKRRIAGHLHHRLHVHPPPGHGPAFGLAAATWSDREQWCGHASILGSGVTPDEALTWPPRRPRRFRRAALDRLLARLPSASFRARSRSS